MTGFDDFAIKSPVILIILIFIRPFFMLSRVEHK